MAEPKIEAHIRPNGHEGYIVEISAPHLGPARVPTAEFKPEQGSDSSSIHRFQMAAASRAAKAYRDGFNEAVGVVSDTVRWLAK